jgi:hypothetical protein
MFSANILPIALILSSSAGFKYGLAFIVTFFVLTRLHHTLKVKYGHFFGVIVHHNSCILAYTTFVHTIALSLYTFSVKLLLNVPLLNGAFLLASRLTSNDDCRKLLFIGCLKSVCTVGALTSTLIILSTE